MSETSSGQRIVQITTVLLFVGLIALACIIGMTVWLTQRADSHLDEILDARNLRTAAVEMRDALQTAESSQRGYLLTGNEIYLAPYGTSKIAANRKLDKLIRAAALRPELQPAISRLSALAKQKFTEMDQTIDLKRNRQDEDALNIVRTNRGKRSTDEANVFFTGIILAADERLTKGGQEQISNAQLLRLVSLAAGLVIVLVTVGAVFAVSRYTRTLADAWNDVRELNKGLEKRVADRTARLAQVNEEIQRFAYIVSHDLRAPLVNIMGFTSEFEHSMLSVERALSKSARMSPDPVIREAMDILNVDVPEAIGFVRSSTTKMDGLINAILKLSREGSRKPQIEELDLSQIVEVGLSALQHQLQSAEGSVNLNLGVLRLSSDRLSVEQIIANVLENAIKYRALDRALRIDISSRYADGGAVLLEIGDNGRGIAPENVDRVFELFRRAGTLDQPGEGIGLAHVRTLARNLKGDVKLTSELNRGTRISVMLPNLQS